MPYKILSLDGGGSWAIIEALALKALYGGATPGQQILNKFDLVTANSGGSIVLAALLANYTPDKMIGDLNSPALRSSLFVPNFLHIPDVEKYNTPAKLAGLQTYLGATGNQNLSSFKLNCKILIPSFDYDSQRVQFFRSDVNSPSASVPGALQPTLAEAVHASTNAPIKYFDAPAQFNTPAFAGRRFWDGAMAGFNNPVLAGVVEALAYGTNPVNIRALTLGTASVSLPMPSPIPVPGSSGQNPLCVEIDQSGLVHDLGKAAGTIVDDPPDEASYVAHLVISGAAGLSQDPTNPITNGNVVRLSPLIQPLGPLTGLTVPPLLSNAPAGSSVAANYANDQAAFTALVNLDMDATDQNDVDLITTLANTWMADESANQCIRATSDFKPLVGQGKFSAAVTQAKALGLA